MPSTTHRLLRDIANAQLEPALAAQLREITRRNRHLRRTVEGLLHELEQYELANLPQERALLQAMRKHVHVVRKLMPKAKPFRSCPACDGGERDGCTVCGGRWWVSKTKYWEWRKSTQPLPNPSTPSILEP